MATYVNHGDIVAMQARLQAKKEMLTNILWEKDSNEEDDTDAKLPDQKP